MQVCVCVCVCVCCVCVDVCVFINGTLFVRPSERAGQAVLFIYSDIMAGDEIAVVRQ